MKPFSVNGLAPGTTAKERAEILADFDGSGLSAAAFARRRRIKYTTFCFWRQQRDKARGSLRFAEVELAAAVKPAEVFIELGAQVRVRIGSITQVPLVAALVHELNRLFPC